MTGDPTTAGEVLTEEPSAPTAERILYDTATGVIIRLPPHEARLTVGRSRENDIPVPIHPERGERSSDEIFRAYHPGSHEIMMRISKSHARLHVGGDSVEIEDVGSRNGTYVGERRLEPGERYPLQNGDVLHLDKWGVQFLEEPEAILWAKGNSKGIYQLRTQ